MYFLDEYKPQQRMHSRFILESSIAPQLYPSLIWATRYFQVTMFFSSPVFSGLFSILGGGEYFQCSNPIETHVRLASAMLLPPTSIGGHHFFLKYQMMNGWLSSAQLLIIAHGIFQSHPCPSIDGTHFCFSLSIFSIYYAPSLSLTKL